MKEVLKPGTRLFSAVCAAEAIVVKAPAEPIDVCIGGVAPGRAPVAPDARALVVTGHDGGISMGKRYTNAAATVEVMCTKPGVGVLSVDGELLQPKDAKALPSSD